MKLSFFQLLFVLLSVVVVNGICSAAFGLAVGFATYLVTGSHEFATGGAVAAAVCTFWDYFTWHYDCCYRAFVETCMETTDDVQSKRTRPEQAP